MIRSDALTLASERHSKDMGRYDFFAHDTAKSSYFPAGSKPWDRMARSGYDYSNSSRAENLVAGYDTARKAFEAWRAYPGHNRNMLNRNQKVIGIARVPVPGSKYGWYWPTDFSSEKDRTSHAPGETPSSERKQADGKEQKPRVRANYRG
ncbi:MAG: CAP domain-containing protein [Actinomycetota bacterium]|nr:CAP domain-containing protein [Actinomycetota bacterium]